MVQKFIRKAPVVLNYWWI